jgi:predicted site-specific integrase-resolvase
MTSAQAAERLKVDHSTVNKWIKAGLFSPPPARKWVGARAEWDISQAAIDAFKPPTRGRKRKGVRPA